LAELGAQLAEQVRAAVPGWVTRCVEERLAPDAPGRVAVLVDAEAAGRAAADAVAEALVALLAAPVDAQWSTPLEIVRGAVTYPTAVLVAAGVAPGRRDRFDQERFPDDLFGLTPASLEALDPSLAEPAIAWGAAKAFAHRRRHGGH
jgi:hypothetical protein